VSLNAGRFSKANPTVG